MLVYDVFLLTSLQIDGRIRYQNSHCQPHMCSELHDYLRDHVNNSFDESEC